MTVAVAEIRDVEDFDVQMSLAPVAAASPAAPQRASAPYEMPPPPSAPKDEAS